MSDQTPQDPSPEEKPEENAPKQEPAATSETDQAEQNEAPTSEDPTEAAGDPVQQVRKLAEANEGKLLKLALVAGAAVFFVSFFLPWWTLSAEVDRPKDPSADDAKLLAEEEKEFSDALEDGEDFKEDSFDRRDGLDFYKDLQDEGEASLWGMGWDFGTGITAFIFSFLIVGLAAASLLLPMALPSVKPYTWAPLLAAAVLGFIVLLLDVIFIIASPGDNMGGEFHELDQGISIAPLLVFPAAIVVVAAGGIGGVMGLMTMLKRIGKKTPE
jgi:hypothetical protein